MYGNISHARIFCRPQMFTINFRESRTVFATCVSARTVEWRSLVKRMRMSYNSNSLRKDKCLSEEEEEAKEKRDTNLHKEIVRELSMFHNNL